MAGTPDRWIDAHQHVFWHRRDDRALIADMDVHGIEQAWLLTWEIAPGEHHPAWVGNLNPVHRRADGTHPGIPLEDLLRARDRFPDRFTIGFSPHPLLGDVAARFEAAHAMYGVRVCGEFKCRLLMDDPRCLELFRVAGALRCPVVLHLDVPYLPAQGSGASAYQPNWLGGTIDTLERVLRTCPETIFIGHAPGFWRHISGDADRDPAVYPAGPVVRPGRMEGLFAAHPNLRADLSANSALRALKRDPTYAAELLAGHADRFLFGRDDYGEALLDFLATLPLSEEVRHRIGRQNASTLLTAAASAGGKA